MLNIVLFGAPGTGKGTQSGLVIEKYKLIHISTGDLLRDAIKNGTPLGKLAKFYIDNGQLVPDSIILKEVYHKAMTHNSAPGFVFDGFPRTIAQASTLDKMLEKKNVPINMVFYLEVDEEELYKRIMHRARMSGRTDDNEDTVRKRIKVYNEQTFPLLNYYKQQGKCIQIDGMHDIDAVFGQIQKHIDSYLELI